MVIDMSNPIQEKMTSKYNEALKNVKCEYVTSYIKNIVLQSKDKEGAIKKPSNQELKVAREFLARQKTYDQLTTFLENVGLAITRGGASDSVEMQIIRKEFETKFLRELKKKGIIDENNSCKNALGRLVKVSLNLGKAKPSQDSVNKAS